MWGEGEGWKKYDLYVLHYSTFPFRESTRAPINHLALVSR